MTICKNCGYHDPAEEAAEKCPACYFRHDSAPVHKAAEPKTTPDNKEAAPAKEAEAVNQAVPKEEVGQEAPVEEAASETGKAVEEKA